MPIALAALLLAALPALGLGYASDLGPPMELAGEVPAVRGGPVPAQERSLEVDKPTFLKKAPVDLHRSSSIPRCPLSPHLRLELAQAPLAHGSYLYIRLSKKLPDCEFQEGYVFMPHLSGESLSSAFGICEQSWEEKPGVADYTTFDSFTGRPSASADRPQEAALQGNPNYRVLGFCQRAQVLRPCFERVVSGPRPEAAAFRGWAAARGLDPVQVFLAHAAQETDLGLLQDACWYGRCNGIGLVQVITAISPEGTRISDNDSRWQGVTFNILTNIGYGLRVLSSNLPHSSTLWKLAYHYNGSSGAAGYADKVESFYGQLNRCGL